MRAGRMATAALAAIGAVVLLGGCHSGSAGGGSGAGNPGIISPLSAVALPHPGHAMHEGSWDRSGGNGDFRPVMPGQTITLFDHEGAGIVRRFWCTIAPRADEKIHSQAILRMYWDDSKEPCVEAPIGEFFGVGFGQQKDYVSAVMDETSGGYNCYWPMPFHKHARWTLTNLSDKKIDAFYYNIDYTAYDSLPADMKHFHASWRRERPTDPKRNYTILEAEGDGQFVGVALFMQAIKPRDIGFLEGDECIYIDQPNVFAAPTTQKTEPADQVKRAGRPTPQIIGTGTEDYFSSGWYFDRGTYSAPYHGCIIKDEQACRISAYRWHIEEAMPFHQNIRVSIEHGTNNDHVADYSSVAYFYQGEPHKAYPALPERGDYFAAAPPAQIEHFKEAIEAEGLQDGSKVSNGNLNAQQMGGFGGHWSGDTQLFWTDAKPGDWLTLRVPAAKEGEYELAAWMTTAPDYGTVEVKVNGQEVGKQMDLYSPGVAEKLETIGRVHLRQGKNEVRFQITGKDERSTNYFVGIDALRLREVK